jgi:hypothetical protein
MIVGPTVGPTIKSLYTSVFVGPTDCTNRLAQQSTCVDMILTVGPAVGPVVIEIERVHF